MLFTIATLDNKADFISGMVNFFRNPAKQGGVGLLLNTDLKLVLSCPHCLRTEVQEFSLFSLSGGWTVGFRCSCGTDKFILSSQKNKQNCLLSLVCPICKFSHSFSFSFQELFAEQLHILYCEETGQEICSLGWGVKMEKKVLANSKDEDEDLWEQFGCSEYFHDPEVMFKCLDYLHQLASYGEIFCQCGNKKIEVDVFPEKIELFCSRCTGLGMIFAETEQDYLTLEKVKRIELLKNGFKRIALSKPIRSRSGSDEKMD